MSHSWARSLLVKRRYCISGVVPQIGCSLFQEVNHSILAPHRGLAFTACSGLPCGVLRSLDVNSVGYFGCKPPDFASSLWFFHRIHSLAQGETSSAQADSSDGAIASDAEQSVVDNSKNVCKKSVDFAKIESNKLPTVILVGRPNVGKSALFNRLIRRREALVYNTPDDHVTRDIREGIAKLGDLRFRVLDSAGLETEATSGSILGRTASMTANVLSRTQFVVFLVDARTGLHPLDFEVGKWLRKHAPGITPIVAINKCESLCDGTGSIAEIAEEVRMLGFGDPIGISAETGLGMTTLYAALQPLLQDYMVQVLNGVSEESNGSEPGHDNTCGEVDESKLPLQLALVGRPNVGKSTLLNTLLQEERVLVGPEAGLTRDSVRAQFEFQGRTIYLVDTAGWLHRTGQEKGPSSLSIVQSRKNLMRAHVVALVLDGEEIAKARRSMTHAEVVIARRAVEEGRALVVIVNKMDVLRRKENAKLLQKVMEAVPSEIQTVIPQVTGIPVVFVSALEGSGRKAVMQQIITTYEKWCLRLSTARLNRWLRKVMSRHSWKDQAAQLKIKYFTQVKARPPTFVAFTSGKTQLLDTDIRFLTKSLKEDFDLGGIPIRIMQRSVPVKYGKSNSRKGQAPGKMAERIFSDKRTLAVEAIVNTHSGVLTRRNIKDAFRPRGWMTSIMIDAVSDLMIQSEMNSAEGRKNWYIPCRFTLCCKPIEDNPIDMYTLACIRDNWFVDPTILPDRIYVPMMSINNTGTCFCWTFIEDGLCP